MNKAKQLIKIELIKILGFSLSSHPEFDRLTYLVGNGYISAKDAAERML